MKRRELVKRAAEAYVEADKRYADAVKVWEAELSTNDPALASALVCIAAELRAARLKARLDTYDA